MGEIALTNEVAAVGDDFKRQGVGAHQAHEQPERQPQKRFQQEDEGAVILPEQSGTQNSHRQVQQHQQQQEAVLQLQGFNPYFSSLR